MRPSVCARRRCRRLNFHERFRFRSCAGEVRRSVRTAQLYARAVPPVSGSSGSAALWTGAVVLAAALLELSAWWWSLVTVRRHLRGWFRQNPPDFDRDASLAREVGDLFGIDSQADEAVQSYAERLRRELGLRAPSVRTQRHSPPEGDEPDE